MNIRKKENYRPKGKDKKKKKIQRKKIAKKWNTFCITSDPIRFIRKLIKMPWLKAAAKRAMLFENHWIVKIVIVSIVKIVIVSENVDRFTDWTKC